MKTIINNLSIRAQLVSLSAVVSIFFVLIYSISIYRLDVAAERLVEARDSSFSTINSVYKNELITAYNIRLLFSKAAQREEFYEQFNRGLNDWARSIKDKYSEDKSRETQDRLDNFERYYNHVSKLGQITYRFQNGALSEEAYDEYFSQADDLAFELIDSLNDFIEQVNFSIDEEFADVESDVYRDEIIGAILMAIAVVLSLGLVFIASGYLSLPIKEVDTKLNLMADGDFRVRTNVKGKNEIGSLASSINQVSESVGSVVRELNDNGERVAASASELSSVMQHSKKNMEQEKAQFDQISVAVTELSNTSQEVNSNAQMAEEASRLAISNITLGQEHVNRSQSVGEDMSLAIQEASIKVEKLNEYSQSISNVIEVIDNISGQTNLLALNAAIEAARAGDQGRGFAVVADEVRSLAVRTQESTSEIYEAVEYLQSQSVEVSQLMEQNVELIDHNRTITEEVRSAFGQISEAVENISTLNALVNTASSEQADVTQEIAQSLGQLNDIVSLNLAGSVQSNVAAEELAEMAENQKNTLSRFSA
ncbi:methyl-accepting chemotaxis protein [Vibrio sp. B1ASS3]|uniref:methyl-accepting chemotaxis protein n=1 Tax=Vibrio sp. B1ASS3 TaxID=2751176 RepID=UPI001ABA1180|nr:methyl-accepting chemotaxis protein [Vibrio sp. B1ASS3]CAD7824598.1 methyl-accepting chemotaxis protein [Vibrio sp. B1ASS3]CAE6953850.1 methyl-accepting chemotaxis protein [Vibrio sp. B1ASS3]